MLLNRVLESGRLHTLALGFDRKEYVMVLDVEYNVFSPLRITELYTQHVYM